MDGSRPLILMLSLVLLLPVVVSAQEGPYTIETDSYVIEFPTHTWKAMPDTRPDFWVYVNGDSEEDSRLVIRLSMEGGVDIPEFARYDYTGMCAPTWAVSPACRRRRTSGDTSGAWSSPTSTRRLVSRWPAAFTI